MAINEKTTVSIGVVLLIVGLISTFVMGALAQRVDTAAEMATTKALAVQANEQATINRATIDCIRNDLSAIKGSLGRIEGALSVRGKDE